MRVDDLPLGGVNHRIGDVARAPLGQRGAGHHRRGGADVALATADQPVAVQLVEAQARIGVNVPAIEARRGS